MKKKDQKINSDTKVVNKKPVVVKSIVKSKEEHVKSNIKSQARKPKNTHETKKNKALQSSRTASKKSSRSVSPKKKIVIEVTPPVFKFIPPGVGRPPKYKTVEELEKLIDAYFESCWSQKLDMFGNPIWKKDKGGRKTNEPVMIQHEPYTITGLALSIGTFRANLLRYEAKDKFSSAIKRAKERCQQYAEQSLYIGKNPTGAIFNLKNNYGDWKDKTETEHSGSLIWKEEAPK